jgi:hypothetical protein
MVTWADVSDRHSSALARKVREEDPDAWYYAESPHVVAYAQSLQAIDLAISQAEFACVEIGRLLALPETGRKAHLILVRRNVTWDGIVAGAAIRPDGLAFQKGREVFIKATDQVHISRVPHEMVHFRLRDTYGELPLWLEEGLAMEYGWRVAGMWAETKGLKITRSLPATPPERQWSLDAMTALREYPAAPLEARAFYRQSEELARAIVERIGLQKAGDFLKAVAGDGLSWRVVLAEQFGLKDVVLAEVERQVAERSGAARDD